MKQTIAQRIRAARLAKGLSQYTLSQKVDVHERTIVAWESGEHAPSDENWLKLSAALYPELDELFDTSITQYSLDALLTEIDRRGFDVTLSSKKDR